MDDATERDDRRDLILFCTLACVFSWADWGLVIASARGWLPVRVPPNPWGSFGPAAAALVVCSLRGGVAGMGTLLRGVVAWRFPGRLWLFALLAPPALFAFSAAVFAAAGGEMHGVVPVDVTQLAVLAVLLLFFGGPVGEEIGWRGYLLPRLLTRMHPVVASLLIAAVWTVWHLPLFWMPGASQEGSSILYFTLFVAGFSILTTWLYLAAGGSLLSAIAFHHAINLSTYLGPSIQPGLHAHAFDRIFLVVTWVAALGAVWALSRTPDHALPTPQAPPRLE